MLSYVCRGASPLKGKYELARTSERIDICAIWPFEGAYLAKLAI